MPHNPPQPEAHVITLRGGPLDGQAVAWPEGALVVCYAARRVNGEWQLCDPMEAEACQWHSINHKALKRARRECGLELTPADLDAAANA